MNQDDFASSSAPASTTADWSIPGWVRHPRLEGILGTRLGDLAWSDIEHIAAQRVTEDLSIDFKRSHYLLDRTSARAVLIDADAKAIDQRVAKDRQELAKDVTAFANASGGLILIGVADTNGRAAEITSVNLQDSRRLSYLDTIRSWTTPFLSGIEVGHVSPSGNPDMGCVLIYVPSSADSPHAVAEPNTHRHTWFVRDGAHSNPLSEAQVAVAYRDRFAGRSDVSHRVREAFDHGVAELDRGAGPWLAVAVVPSKGATRRHLERKVLDEFKTQTQKRQDELPGPFLGHHATYGRGKIVLRDNDVNAASASDHLLHLGLDGSSFGAVTLGTLDDTSSIRRYRPALEDDCRAIRISSLITWALTLTGIAAGHAIDAGGSGDLELVCGIVAGIDAHWVSTDHPQPPIHHVVLDAPWRRSSDEDMVAGTTWRDTLTPVQLSTSASVASDTRELISLGAQLVAELVAEFGHLPNEPILSADGFVIGQHCQHSLLEGIRAWAEVRNLLIEQQ